MSGGPVWFCHDIYADDNMDIFVRDRIKASKDEPPIYSLTMYNCIDWAFDMVRERAEGSAWENVRPSLEGEIKYNPI